MTFNFSIWGAWFKPAAAKLTVVLTSRCDLVTEALASLLSGFIEALSTLTAM